eukprot:568926-Ditylum_brightwellii.AAC.1
MAPASVTEPNGAQDWLKQISLCKNLNYHHSTCHHQKYTKNNPPAEKTYPHIGSDPYRLLMYMQVCKHQKSHIPAQKLQKYFNSVLQYAWTPARRNIFIILKSVSQRI